MKTILALSIALIVIGCVHKRLSQDYFKTESTREQTIEDFGRCYDLAVTRHTSWYGTHLAETEDCMKAKGYSRYGGFQYQAETIERERRGEGKE